MQLRDKTLVVRPFATTHPVPSLGYTVFRRTHKLRPQYAAAPGAEIAALRAAGVGVTDAVEAPLFAFTGDTSADWLHHPSSEAALRAKVLVVECTFVDAAVSVADARLFGHTHLDELAEHAALFRNEAILLIHFSARYKRTEILAALDARLPPDLRARVTPLLEGFS